MEAYAIDFFHWCCQGYGKMGTQKEKERWIQKKGTFWAKKDFFGYGNWKLLVGYRRKDKGKRGLSIYLSLITHLSLLGCCYLSITCMVLLGDFRDRKEKATALWYRGTVSR